MDYEKRKNHINSDSFIQRKTPTFPQKLSVSVGILMEEINSVVYRKES